MANKQYEKGRRAEYDLVNRARRIGLDARRTAGSKGPYDVAITNNAHQWLVNVKCDQWASPAERGRLAFFVSEWTTAVLANRITGGKWYYRILDRKGVMSEVTQDIPWSPALCE